MPTIKLPTIKSSSDKDHLEQKAVTLSDQPERSKRSAASRASVVQKKRDTQEQSPLPVRPLGEPKPATGYQQELARAQELHRAGQPAAARAIYEQLVDDVPGRPEAYHRLGLIAAGEQRHREAEGLYAQALSLNPRSAEVLNDLGCSFYCQGKLAEAENATLKAVAVQPLDPQLRANLGVIYGHQGRLREALEQFRLAGNEADACANLAEILAARNDEVGAKDFVRKALAADPGHARAKRVLEVLSAEHGPKTDNPLRIADPSGRPEKTVR